MSILQKLLGRSSHKDDSEPIPGFRILDRVARGTKSELFRAEREGADETVVIKVLDERAGEVVDKLKRVGRRWEGEWGVRLEHPHVIQTFEFGNVGGSYYIVMELLRQGNLKRLLQTRNSFLKGFKLPLLLAVAHGLNYIHQQGMIHRDISAKNVLFDIDGVPKVIDFGVAIAAGEKVLKRGDWTGTPSHMAPELITNKIYDHRTDIYAFGVLMYEVLTGRLPYGGADSSTRMIQHLNAQLVPPRHINEEIPPEVEAVMVKALEKTSTQRFQTMDRVVTALTAVKDFRV